MNAYLTLIRREHGVTKDTVCRSFRDHHRDFPYQHASVVLAVAAAAAVVVNVGGNNTRPLVIFSLITASEQRSHRMRKRLRRTTYVNRNRFTSGPRCVRAYIVLRSDSNSWTFRNNSAPRARSCVPRPGSFFPFCAPS